MDSSVSMLYLSMSTDSTTFPGLVCDELDPPQWYLLLPNEMVTVASFFLFPELRVVCLKKALHDKVTVVLPLDAEHG